MVLLWYLKNNFIFLVKKIFIFVNDFKKTKRISSIPDSNRFTREFSVRRSAVIRIDESDRGTQPASYDEFGAFQIFRSRSPWNPKPWC